MTPVEAHGKTSRNVSNHVQGSTFGSPSIDYRDRPSFSNILHHKVTSDEKVDHLQGRF